MLTQLSESFGLWVVEVSTNGRILKISFNFMFYSDIFQGCSWLCGLKMVLMLGVGVK